MYAAEKRVECEPGYAKIVAKDGWENCQYPIVLVFSDSSGDHDQFHFELTLDEAENIGVLLGTLPPAMRGLLAERATDA